MWKHSDPAQTTSIAGPTFRSLITSLMQEKNCSTFCQLPCFYWLTHAQPLEAIKPARPGSHTPIHPHTYTHTLKVAHGYAVTRNKTPRVSQSCRNVASQTSHEGYFRGCAAVSPWSLRLNHTSIPPTALLYKNRPLGFSRKVIELCQLPVYSAVYSEDLCQEKWLVLALGPF